MTVSLAFALGIRALLAGVPAPAEAPKPPEARRVAKVDVVHGEKRQDDYLDNLSRKLLSYALGRTLLLSDDPVVDRMKGRLAADGYRFAPPMLQDQRITPPAARRCRRSQADESARS